MSTQIQAEHFTKALYALLDETFDNVHGYFLDRGTSMFETLATISADEASLPVGGKCATLAAQVEHVTFYLDVLEKSVRTGQYEPQDWDKIWRETSAVTPAEWEALKPSMLGWILNPWAPHRTKCCQACSQLATEAHCGTSGKTQTGINRFGC